jgi:hypothetical protein
LRIMVARRNAAARTKPARTLVHGRQGKGRI